MQECIRISRDQCQRDTETLAMSFHMLFFTNNMSGSPLVYLCPVYTSDRDTQACQSSFLQHAGCCCYFSYLTFCLAVQHTLVIEPMTSHKRHRQTLSSLHFSGSLVIIALAENIQRLVFAEVLHFNFVLVCCNAIRNTNKTLRQYLFYLKYLYCCVPSSGTHCNKNQKTRR